MAEVTHLVRKRGCVLGPGDHLAECVHRHRSLDLERRCETPTKCHRLMNPLGLDRERCSIAFERVEPRCVETDLFREHHHSPKLPAFIHHDIWINRYVRESTTRLKRLRLSREEHVNRVK